MSSFWYCLGKLFKLQTELAEILFNIETIQIINNL